MNHAPQDCRFLSCAQSCKAAATNHHSDVDKPQANIEIQDDICDCCHAARANKNCSLCASCFQHPTAYIDCIVKELGLVEEQAVVLSYVAQGENVFFTGAGGTGKSRLISAITRYLRGLGLGVAVTAPTGIAAVNIDGTTLHSYAAWDGNVSRVRLEELCNRAHQKKVWNRFKKTDAIIIDEISMVESNVFTRLSQMMQAAASTRPGGRERQPFGGAQVVISGDFFQLPPVKPFAHCLWCGQATQTERGGYVTCEKHGVFEMDAKFAFSSPVWDACNLKNVELKYLHRQTDSKFISLLRTCRRGFAFSADEEETLLNHPHTVSRDEATKLCPRLEEVRRINAHHMDQLSPPPLQMTGFDHFEWYQEFHPELSDVVTRVDGPASPLTALKSHRYEFELELKLNMQVLLLANIDPPHRLVNGSIGKIVGFVKMGQGNMPRRPQNKKDTANLTGQLIYGEHARYKVARIKEFCETLPEERRKWPVVLFKNGLTRVIFASCLVSELGKEKPYSLLSRTQIPLVAGWALSIHKSQGMPLDSAIVDLASCWEPGQVYVALSRARGLDGLIVETLPKTKVADPIVEQFMEGTFGQHSTDDMEAVIAAKDATYG